MISREEFVQNLRTFNHKFFEKKYPTIAFAILCATDYYYVEGIAMGKVNESSDPVMRKTILLAQQGLMMIPGVGQVLTLVMDFIAMLGVDLASIEIINKSKVAQNRLREWKCYIQENYAQNKYDIPDLPDVNRRFIQEIDKLISARPKCGSPTSGCGKEHNQYIMRTSLMKEAQASIYDMYYSYCSSQSAFNNFIQQNTYYEPEEKSGEKPGKKPETKKVSNKSLVILSLLLSFIMKKL